MCRLYYIERLGLRLSLDKLTGSLATKDREVCLLRSKREYLDGSGWSMTAPRRRTWQSKSTAPTYESVFFTIKTTVTSQALPHKNWHRGPMDKALVYGTRDSGFDPQRSRCFVFFCKSMLANFGLHFQELNNSGFHIKIGRLALMFLECSQIISNYVRFRLKSK
jgi:hypothetical protein